MKKSLSVNIIISVRTRAMAILTSVKLLVNAKIRSEMRLKQTLDAVAMVTCLVFPIAPRQGQPKITDRKPKNKTGIRQRKTGEADKYSSPPRTRKILSEMAKVKIQPAMTIGIKIRRIFLMMPKLLLRIISG